MKYYAVIDTNVLVAYMLTKNEESSRIGIIQEVEKGTIIPMYNEAIINEYESVLSRKHFCFNQGSVARIISLLKQAGIDSERQVVNDCFPDEDDIVFYEVTMSRDDSYLITGNLKHFPKSGRVVSPSEMLQIIRIGELPYYNMLSDKESPEYLPIGVDEINAIIRNDRIEYAKYRFALKRVDELLPFVEDTIDSPEAAELAIMSEVVIAYEQTHF